VAGKRAGLGGARSNLWFEFERVLSELLPRWAIIENVPGLLSSNGGADFAVILDALDELGFDAAWAVLDAQHFGVPQRRRRVFIVAGPRGRGAEQVLSVCESCGGNPAAGRATGEGLAATLGASSARIGGISAGNNPGTGNLIASPLGAHHRRDDLDNDTYVVASPVAASAGHHGYSSPRGDGADTLRSHPRPGSNSVGALYVPEIVGQPVSAKWAKGSSGPAGDEVQKIVVVDGVRHLTPRECERLMGWPDDHTRWTADDREISNSHRYRMIGNGVVATVAEWLGHRLMAVDALALGHELTEAAGGA
jgi:DNA (cytosine-5)-methyltransferase 1